MKREIIWQYSPEWQREMGIFSPKDSRKPLPTKQSQPTAVDVTTADDDDYESDYLEQLFVLAKDKLEAITRITNLTTGRPQQLGPGSTERKSVLTDLADALGMPESAHQLTKPNLGKAIAELGQVDWGDNCWSEGSTITLVGLNRLLEVAEQRLTPVAAYHRSPALEATDLSAFIAPLVGEPFYGRSCVKEMFDAGSRDWAKSEWPGWYFEFKVLSAMMAHFGGAPIKAPNATIFDYKGSHIWDLKTHSRGSDVVILNDQSAIEWALANGGLGFIILHGEAKFDLDFKEWVTEFKLAQGKTPIPRAHERSYERRLKSEFRPDSLETFFFENQRSWDSAIAAGAIKTHAQGRQVSGHARAPKFEMHLGKARANWQLEEITLPV